MIEAEGFDVRHRYFAAGADYDTLTLAHYQAVPPTGWTVSGDAITPPSGWTEITGIVTWAGELTLEWRDQVETWRASLAGRAYDPQLLGQGRAIVGFVRYRVDSYDWGWQCEFVGAVTSYQWSDAHRAGEPWQISVGGTDTQIATSDGPRIVTGVVNLAEGADLAPSATLAVPAVEAGNGEFVGATANVDPDNMIDGRLSTPWIAADAPTITGEGAVAGHKINEVFAWPVAGYATDGVWWVEIFNNAADSSGLEVNQFLAYTAAGKIAVIALPQTKLYAGQSIIICRNRAQAEAYAGSFQQAAQVYETDALGSREFAGIVHKSGIDGAGNPISWDELTTTGQYCQFDLNPAGGWVFWWQEGGWLPGGAFLDAVKWGASVAGPGGSDPGQWTGATVALPPTAQSLRRSPACVDSGTAADWVAGIPSPGGYFTPNSAQWVKVELRPHTSTLASDVAAGATSLTFAEGTAGWPAGGEGVIDGDVFAYTGRAGDTLTGVTGLLAHAAGSLAYPYAEGQAQSGWRSSEVRIKRPPGLPKIKQVRVWTSPNANCRNYDVYPFWVDYAEPFYTIVNGTQTAGGLSEQGALADIGIPLRPPRGDDRWVRTILIAIDAMWGGGRAKINELVVVGDDMTVGGAFVPAVGSTKAAALAAYLVDGYSWLAAADFVDATGDGWGLIGGVATAVAPLPIVLQDLARGHGCVARYTPLGQVVFCRDPWWPGGAGTIDEPPYPLYGFSESNVREEIRFSGQQTPITGVAVAARDTQGNALPRHVYPPGASGSGVAEQNDVTVRSEKDAMNLAFYLYLKLAAEARATLTVRGIGQAMRPRQRARITWRGRDMGQWIIERVTRRWRWDGQTRRFETELELRSYMGMP